MTHGKTQTRWIQPDEIQVDLPQDDPLQSSRIQIAQPQAGPTRHNQEPGDREPGDREPDTRKPTVLEKLLDQLELEKIEENIFRGKSQDLGHGAVFGGQVLGQSLSAMSQTLPEDRHVHSFHGYFLRRGDPARSIVYQVDCIRDGKSFTTRRVVAIQLGRPIFSMSASFQIEEQGFEHQADAPDVPGPENLISELKRARQVKDRIPPSIRPLMTSDRPIEIRVVNPVNPFAPEKQPPRRYAWFRAAGALPDDPVIHRYLLAYASDFGLLAASLYPHGHTFWERQMQVASLDHAMWFHRDFRMDEWLLYAVESPNAQGARGLNFGRIFTMDGRLAASTAQEGLIRYHMVSSIRSSGAARSMRP